ncbi:aldehyde ferredoxin oxidoreductase N-terminal domain-containing protein [Symbiobacterium thermophilum]|uniref:aldehyde ferredoxin oxidoreductase N-terminal domain-containing protein n=1 Tax=Symbiobacterium thermophilum TaxID=2734 RepID=UPI002352A0B2|nr:aldehyde ferredoxin oxidoreductase N-terminal domain-containing protein [Symbiobacterium thermophilum]
MDRVAERVLRVDLTSGKVSVEPLPPLRGRDCVGPRGRAAACLLADLDPTVDPLGPGSKLAFAAGACAALPLPGASRLVVAGLSPVTGLYADAEAGGVWAAALARVGFAAVVVEGRADRPVYLELSESGARLGDASRLWGLTTVETQAALRVGLADPAAQAVVIGPAGEHAVPFACILHGSTSAAGRAGLGAAMGAKGLKAVVVRSGQGAAAGGAPAGCAGCPRPCRSAALGHKTRQAFAELGLLDAADLREANWLCNAYGLDTLATAAALRGVVRRRRRERREEVFRLIPRLARGELPCSPEALRTADVRRQRDGVPGERELDAVRAAKVLGICRWVVAPSGPLALERVLAGLKAASGASVTSSDLAREEARTEEAIAAFNRGAAAARASVV